MPTLNAVPGAMWPGSIWPAEPIIPAVTGPPVIFSAGRARHLWSVVRARNSEGAGMVLTQPAVSLEPVQVQVSALLNGAAYDPISDPVELAFIPVPTFGAAAAPAASSPSWQAATWETDSNPVTYWASILVGPGGVSLTAGTSYQVFVKVTDSTSGATPIIPGPSLVIT